MNYQAESGAVWLLLFALAIIRAANAVEETVVVENWWEADDLCAHAKAGQHFVIRCKHRCECREGTVCVPYCPPLQPPPGKSNCKLVKEENECCGQWKCNEVGSVGRVGGEIGWVGRGSILTRIKRLPRNAS